MSRTAHFPPGSDAGRRTYLQLLVAVGVLSLGALVYVVDRSADATPHLNALHALGIWPEYSFGRVGDHLPTFAHTFAFSVLTASLLGRAWHATSCLAWLLINALFELGQAPYAAGLLAEWLSPSLKPALLVDALERYFASGTFDVWDLVSICAGAAAAYTGLRYRGTEVVHG